MFWAGIVDEFIIGPYVIRDGPDLAQFADFLEETLPLLLENEPLHMRESMWFQHDGALPILPVECAIGSISTFLADGLDVEVGLPGIHVLLI
jgi:hypothetical protein